VFGGLVDVYEWIKGIREGGGGKGIVKTRSGWGTERD